MSRPADEIFKFLIENGVETFVETGTFHGGGVIMARKNGFPRIISIEVAREFHEECLEKFAEPIAAGQVELVYGDSAVCIGDICKRVEEPCIFWLDAHFQGVEAEFDASNCPLNAELEAIIARGNPKDVIMIDDLRLLQTPSAWRGHDVVLDKALGQLHRAYTDSVAVYLDGYVPRDVFAIIPGDLAQGFFQQFPDGRKPELAPPPIAAPAITSSEVDEGHASEAAPLIVFAGGHNSRLGNMLSPYLELRMVCERIGRPLVFPFAEDVLSRFFNLGSANSLSETVEQARTLYGRMIRSAEERLEADEGVGPYQYSTGKIHQITLEQLGVDVLIHRGQIDWAAATANGVLSGSRPILIKDPFPFNVSKLSLPELLAKGSSYLAPKDEIFAQGALLRKSQCPENALDIVFHHRQGDFATWHNGDFWYDGALMNELLDRIIAYGSDKSRAPHITIISDEALPADIAGRADITFQSQSLEEDFTRMAASDAVLSNNSTFSRIAACVGQAMIGNDTRFFSLGAKEDAMDRIDLALGEIFA